MLYDDFHISDSAVLQAPPVTKHMVDVLITNSAAASSAQARGDYSSAIILLFLCFRIEYISSGTCAINAQVELLIV